MTWIPPDLSNSESVLMKSQPLPNGRVAKVIIPLDPALTIACPLKFVSSDNTYVSYEVTNSDLNKSNDFLFSKKAMTALPYDIFTSI